ncbi:xanthine dehydrogenase family protein molybdopterin-binding subunit [Roseomonas xinghualingensis]|uniref:xanthine dehydrogenase family protein molybdopterin-binding subunit n=1 Tax=Roseomonas xinghualingensis TaxID=2986475 RepID=UPI0021F1B21E|nr:xanthine dehydrogenase family protein molybdopterin-binding subunit [Roseomonas sp. SXEYE001]MCV4207588.1 xanthine dehydrogenase family protein molybdopterin-binding subunit [Roseomonas sp. SXEYE001]
MQQTSMHEPHVGSPRSRVDGRLKVTGAARYAAEYTAPDLAHGYVVSSAIAKGRIKSIDTSAAMAVPGVIQVFTHQNRPRTAWRSKAYQDDVAPPGTPFRPFYDDKILYSGQPVALVVAEDFEIARHAASLVRVTYEAERHETDLEKVRGKAYKPPKSRSGMAPPAPRGDAEAAFGAAPFKVDEAYRIAIEHHNPMEMHASTVVWEGDGKITVYDKIQGVQNTQTYITHVFGLPTEDVRVLSPFVGGAFGAGLRPQYQLFLAVMAALELKRSVRVVLERDQMFTFTYRPDALQEMAIAANPDAVLQAIRHDVVGGTSSFEDYQESIVSWSAMMYHCENVATTYKLAKIDTYTPGDMRAPGAPTGMFALESAMDELSYKLKIDPLQLRLKNYAEINEGDGKPFTSKELRAAYQLGAERFGWSRRNPVPRSMKEGRELIGWGMASGMWEAMMQKTSARAVLTIDEKLEVSTATADIGTGTYTILTQIAADALGLPMEKVTAKIGDSSLPMSPVEGGSWTAASAGSAVQAACNVVREKLFAHARGMDGSPLANAEIGRVAFRDGKMELIADPSRFVTIQDAMRAGRVDRIEAEETAAPSRINQMRYAAYTHSAIFAEVRVDEELGRVRVTRIVDAVAAGKILNPKTARSQILGGVVFGIGMALTEESMMDHNLGRFMNHNIAEYHVPVNADIHDIEVIFVEEHEDKLNPLGVKGLGEIGIVGTAAAIANAVFHATGRRIRHLPITLDKVIGTKEAA